MNNKILQQILPLVEKPSRYIGGEINSIKKEHSKMLLKIALAFPDMYEIGTSHFGMQILYNILNQREEIAAERVFAPALDMAQKLKKNNIPLFTLESKKPLTNFDIIGFSLLYELNYTNILLMLSLSNIPFFAAQRDESYPLIIAGGPAMSNPEPIADFFDAIVIGDGENAIIQLSDIFLDYKKNGKKDKNELLQRWSEIEGVYIPSFFEPEYDENGFQHLIPKYENYKKVMRAITTDFTNAPFPEKPIVAFAKPVHDRLRLEIARGCSNGCRFCQAGMIYRPVREKSVKNLITTCKNSIKTTGYEDISLLSLSTGDFSGILELIKLITNDDVFKHIALSMPSLRANTLNKYIMNYIKKVRKTGFTIAPEAGTQRLRDVINKKITYDEIETAVKDAFSLGWQVIKLYFMMGLPTETEKDILGIISLCKDLKKSIKRSKFNVSITTFIPKPHTPFQWTSQISLEESKEKLNFIKNNLKISGINLKWQSPDMSMLEGVWARGDRRLSNLLVKAFENGCVFDGWTDKLNMAAWNKSFDQTDINPDFYTTRKRDLKEPLPWNHIDVRVKKEFLIKELEKAYLGEITDDCKTENCNNCGVCDFEKIKPEILNNHQKQDVTKTTSFDAIYEKKDSLKEYKKYEVLFSKKDSAKYIGHLEMVKIFSRALSRAGVAIKFSEGFHPMPKISFQDTLPVGMESLSEYMYLTVEDNIKPNDIVLLLNAQLPDGFNIHDCFIAGSLKKYTDENLYEITTNGILDKEKLALFNNQKECIMEIKRGKGKKRKIDLKKAVKKIEMTAANKLYISIAPVGQKTIRPAPVLKNIFGFSDDELKVIRVVKI
jgi:radical SAM family uncharacterized protein/radical SAM-linked protein